MSVWVCKLSYIQEINGHTRTKWKGKPQKLRLSTYKRCIIQAIFNSTPITHPFYTRISLLLLLSIFIALACFSIYLRKTIAKMYGRHKIWILFSCHYKTPSWFACIKNTIRKEWKIEKNRRKCINLKQKMYCLHPFSAFPTHYPLLSSVWIGSVRQHHYTIKLRNVRGASLVLSPHSPLMPYVPQRCNWLKIPSALSRHSWHWARTIQRKIR